MLQNGRAPHAVPYTHAVFASKQVPMSWPAFPASCKLLYITAPKSGLQLTSTGCPMSCPALTASRKPFSQAGMKLGGMALPTMPFSNSNLVGWPAAGWGSKRSRSRAELHGMRTQSDATDVKLGHGGAA